MSWLKTALRVVSTPAAPLSLVITAGQRGDFPQFEAALSRIRVRRPGRPRTRLRKVRADEAYSPRENRA
ncbi:hypothetical protein [Streptomyces sp. NPDC056661]|uniref:hypothetical protein n=1 Tax=Streptomyces sp. NPDC056661 TaxID=3345898 RepID=UPI0036C9AACF